MAFVYPVLNNEMAYLYKKNLYLGLFLYVQGNIKNNLFVFEFYNTF